MATYEFRFVGEDDTLATQELDQDPIPGEAVSVDGISYAVEGVDPTHWGQSTIVYVYDPEVS